MKNRGVILGRKPTDYIAGASPIIYEARNPSGDWTPYLPPGEWQRSTVAPIADTMSCVTYSALNSIETQENFLTGLQVDYADRWTAKRSGTTELGNWLYKVADTIRNDGLVLETDYPDSDYHSFAEYMANIPEPLTSQLLAKGKEWLVQWDLAYEWVEVSKVSFLHHLKQSPLQIVIPGHAVLNFNCPDDVVKYLDSYEPWVKQTTHGNIQDALKLVLTKKIMSNALIVTDGNQYGVVEWGTNPDGLETLLKSHGLGELPRKTGGNPDWDKINQMTKGRISYINH